MPADWMASGACTNGLTGPRGVGTRRSFTRRGECGGAFTTSTPTTDPSHEHHGHSRGTGDFQTHGFRASFPTSVLGRLSAAVYSQWCGDDCLVRFDVGNGQDADARRLVDVDGVDADARAELARSCGVVPRHVGRDDGGNDDAMSDPN